MNHRTQTPPQRDLYMRSLPVLSNSYVAVVHNVGRVVSACVCVWVCVNAPTITLQLERQISCPKAWSAFKSLDLSTLPPPPTVPLAPCFCGPPSACAPQTIPSPSQPAHTAHTASPHRPPHAVQRQRSREPRADAALVVRCCQATHTVHTCIHSHPSVHSFSHPLSLF